MDTTPQSQISDSNGFVIVLEDDAITGNLVVEFLSQQNVIAVTCQTIQEAKQLLQNHPEVDGILVDIGLPDGDGIEFLRSVRKALPLIPCLILTARDEAHSAVLAMKAGATDYLTKPFEPDALMAFVAGPVQFYRHRNTLESENQRPRHQQIRWKSPVMLKAIQSAWTAAGTESPILLLGSGNTGKSTLAEFIHQHSTRSEEKLLVIDVATLRPDHMAIALFGTQSDHEPAASWRNGRVAAIEKGSVYLENIDHLDISSQAAMVAWYESVLTRLERGVSSPRLITSSCCDLEEMVNSGKFREDLWYLLSVFQVTVPEVHDRIEDIPLLCEQFITRICVARKLRRPTLTRQAMEILTRHKWPGNLGELQSVLEHAVSNTRDGLIGVKDLPPFRAVSLRSTIGRASNTGYGKSSMEEITKASLLATLENCGGNRRKAAQQLKVSLRTVYNMIQRYELPGKRTLHRGKEQ